ncbi:hypothetical protein DNH61_25225 [Paenibacillus sambharensis]|uniref:Thiopeptide-type bacteriocin biosynthesis domain-containing protein n=1 Tax=Paenibacillus sambharensis TaxID=1803190 RepID=A0A2W1LF99_9BACL|nr:thiopeptide-type bacteriocin biosynthesis protein [Paenibacillus sambharensis]PZD93084.1 hypothetical protein DNH61_25225 [Paenibacillus sambharensis]
MWVAYHIYYHNVSKYDELLILLAEHLERYRVSGSMNKWFFIRYWEGGPHLRVRMLNPSPMLIVDELLSKARAFMAIHPSLTQWSRDEYYANHKFDGEELDKNQLAWHEDGEIVSYEYMPEYDRYGGEAVMDHNENMFMCSSKLCVELLHMSKGEFFRKLLFSCALTSQLVIQLRSAYDCSNSEAYYTFYKEMWSSFVDGRGQDLKIMNFLHKNEVALEKASQILLASESVQGFISEIQSELQTIRSSVQDDYMDYIVASHIHMTNNRLGIPPVYEYFISDYLGQLLVERRA